MITPKADGQILKVDVNAFAGDDSIKFGGSFVSSTLNAGAGNDTIAIHKHRQHSFLQQYSFYAGTGADSVLMTDGANLTVYGDASASDTAGGADSLEITALTSSTVYGAAGGDTLNIGGASNVRFDLGAGTNYATGSGTYTSSTLIGGDGVDKLILNGVTGGG